MKYDRAVRGRTRRRERGEAKGDAAVRRVPAGRRICSRAHRQTGAGSRYVVRRYLDARLHWGATCELAATPASYSLSLSLFLSPCPPLGTSNADRQPPNHVPTYLSTYLSTYLPSYHRSLVAFTGASKRARKCCARDAVPSTEKRRFCF